MDKLKKKTDMSNCYVNVCRYLTCLLNSNYNLNFFKFKRASSKAMQKVATLVASA